MDPAKEPPAKPAAPMMARAGQALIEASQGSGCVPLLYRWLRWLTLWLIIAYGVGLLVLISILSRVGEQNVTTAFLAFLPPLLWLLPAIPLLVAGVLFHRRALLALVVVLTWTGYDFLGWRPGGGSAPQGGKAIRVMTYNRGQHMNQSLRPFIEATRPDIIVMQEAGGRAARYAGDPEYAEFTHGTDLGEHTLLSRFPVVDQKFLPALPGMSSKAVRFVLDLEGRQVALYSVHLHTPRDLLYSQARGGFLYGILGRLGGTWAEKESPSRQFWEAQIADAELVLKALREETLPAIVVGDFNAPSVGYIHRRLVAELGDAHAQAGKGFGWSFPGSTRNPLSGGGPWMRIDYVFFNQQWLALECVTEPDRPSQHRAVSATLELKAP